MLSRTAGMAAVKTTSSWKKVHLDGMYKVIYDAIKKKGEGGGKRKSGG